MLTAALLLSPLLLRAGAESTAATAEAAPVSPFEAFTSEQIRDEYLRLRDSQDKSGLSRFFAGLSPQQVFALREDVADALPERKESLTCDEVTDIVKAYKEVIDQWCKDKDTPLSYWNARIREADSYTEDGKKVRYEPTDLLKAMVDLGDFTTCLTATPCPGRSHSSNLFTCFSNSFGSGVQCNGFANYMAYIVFGVDQKEAFPDQKWEKFWMYHFVPGDVVCYRLLGTTTRHYRFIYDMDDEYYYYVAGNDDGHCGVVFDKMTHEVAYGGYAASTWRITSRLYKSLASDAEEVRTYGPESYLCSCPENEGTYAVVRVEEPAAVHSLPCEPEINRHSTVSANCPAGEEHLVTRFVKNTVGEYWVQLQDLGWVRAEQTSFVAFRSPFRFSDVSLLYDTIAKGSPNSLYGTVEVGGAKGLSYTVTSCYRGDGEFHEMVTVETSDDTYSLVGDLNNKTHFSSIPEGKYTFYVSARTQLRCPTGGTSSAPQWNSLQIIEDSVGVPLRVG